VPDVYLEGGFLGVAPILELLDVLGHDLVVVPQQIADFVHYCRVVEQVMPFPEPEIGDLR